MSQMLLDRIPIEEVLRYLGCSKPEPSMLALVKECILTLLRTAKPRYLYRIFQIESCTAASVALCECDFVLPGKDIAALLKNCDRAVLLCATLSSGVDHLLRETQLTDLSRSLVLESCANAAIEEVCDQVQNEIGNQFPNQHMTMRYSPGYGDLPLSIQGDFLRLLDAPRQIGLCVTDSCILTPRKSVTAIIGIGGSPADKLQKSCDKCNIRETCVFRKKEEHCGLSYNI